MTIATFGTNPVLRTRQERIDERQRRFEAARREIAERSQSAMCNDGQHERCAYGRSGDSGARGGKWIVDCLCECHDDSAPSVSAVGPEETSRARTCECGHPVSKHGFEGCVHSDGDDFCECMIPYGGDSEETSQYE